MIGDDDLFYALCQRFFQVSFVLFFRMRVWGVERVPPKGGVVLAANHQSFLDPPAVGLALPRQVCYLARRSLFRLRPVAWLLLGMHGVPVEREGVDAGAVRRVVRLLRAGRGLVLFPEGTRTRDGSVGPFRPGFAVLASLARVPVVPVAIEGAFEAWPRGRLLPGPGRLRVAYGEAMAPPRGGRGACEEFARRVRERVVALKARLAAME